MDPYDWKPLDYRAIAEETSEDVAEEYVDYDIDLRFGIETRRVALDTDDPWDDEDEYPTG